MSATYIVSLASLARTMGLSPVAAIALPSAVDCAAGKLGYSVPAFIAECRRNEPLRDYLATICATVTDGITELPAITG